MIRLHLPLVARREPDHLTWINRFSMPSSSSAGRSYIIAQNAEGRWWACSCPGWVNRKQCRHLTSVGLPGNQQPFEADLRFAGSVAEITDDTSPSPPSVRRESAPARLGIGVGSRGWIIEAPTTLATGASGWRVRNTDPNRDRRSVNIWRAVDSLDPDAWCCDCSRDFGPCEHLNAFGLRAEARAPEDAVPEHRMFGLFPGLTRNGFQIESEAAGTEDGRPWGWWVGNTVLPSAPRHKIWPAAHPGPGWCCDCSNAYRLCSHLAAFGLEAASAPRERAVGIRDNIARAGQPMRVDGDGRWRPVSSSSPSSTALPDARPAAASGPGDTAAAPHLRAGIRTGGVYIESRRDISTLRDVLLTVRAEDDNIGRTITIPRATAALHSSWRCSCPTGHQICRHITALGALSCGHPFATGARVGRYDVAELIADDAAADAGLHARFFIHAAGKPNNPRALIGQSIQTALWACLCNEWQPDGGCRHTQGLGLHALLGLSNIVQRERAERLARQDRALEMNLRETERAQAQASSLVSRNAGAAMRAVATSNVRTRGLGSIDGEVIRNGDRVLLTNQTWMRENGPYIARNAEWERLENEMVLGTVWYVESGTENRQTRWQLTASGPGARVITRVATLPTVYGAVGTINIGATLGEAFRPLINASRNLGESVRNAGQALAGIVRNGAIYYDENRDETRIWSESRAEWVVVGSGRLDVAAGVVIDDPAGDQERFMPRTAGTTPRLRNQPQKPDRVICGEDEI